MILRIRRRRSALLLVIAAVMAVSAVMSALGVVRSGAEDVTTSADAVHRPSPTASSAATSTAATIPATPAPVPVPVPAPVSSAAAGVGPVPTSSAPAVVEPGTAPAGAPAPYADAPACTGAGRTVLQPFAVSTLLTERWREKSPVDDATYDLSGVTSNAFPSSRTAFEVGVPDAAARTCLLGGTLTGSAGDELDWRWLHDEANAACVKIVATEWMQVQGTRCDNVEDGFRPQENDVNANNARFLISGTYLTDVRDDCLEDDYTLGGVLYDNLWEECHTGISERPSGDRSWSTPADETLTLDHMLIGLEQTLHEEDGEQFWAENALFKWSDSGNRVVIRCSVFLVHEESLNGTDTMAFPPGTVIDDSACPDAPSTLVWLGGGDYPAWAAGVRVTDDVRVWDAAVASWKAAHGY